MSKVSHFTYHVTYTGIHAYCVVNAVVTHIVRCTHGHLFTGAVYYKSADEFPDLAPEDVVSMPDMDPYTMGQVFPDTGVFQGTV